MNIQEAYHTWADSDDDVLNKTRDLEVRFGTTAGGIFELKRYVRHLPDLPETARRNGVSCVSLQ